MAYGSRSYTYQTPDDGRNLPEPGERPVFGVHRLPRDERKSGWTDKTPHPYARWEVAPGEHFYRGEVDTRPMPVVKGFAPGRAWVPDAELSPVNMATFRRKGEGDPGTTWYPCFVCHQPLRGAKAIRQRRVAVPEAEWKVETHGWASEPEGVRRYRNTWTYHPTDKAHDTCPETEEEKAAGVTQYAPAETVAA